MRLPPIDRNGRRLLVAKAFRAFGFGLNAVVLGVYLDALGLDGPVIGLVLSAALAGSMGLTVVIAAWGDRIGRRRLLVAGSALMLLAGVIPFVGASPVSLVALGLTGMVAVNNNESIGIQTLDQAILPHTARDHQRTAAFALYNVVAFVSGAAGAFALGPLAALGGAVNLDGPLVYAPAFVVYGACGLASAAFLSGLDARTEVVPVPGRRLALHRSRREVAMLSGLFAVDSLATGFIVHSYLAFWFASRFALSDATLGTMFAVGNLLAAASFPVAAWLAARIGLVRTMVFTHIPASVFLIGMAVAPIPSAAIALFFARAALSSMDQPARQSYLMAVVDPDERTAASGVTNLARGGAVMIGPGLAGWLLVPMGAAVPLIAGGLVKIAYDLGLFALFRARTAPEESRPAAVGGEPIAGPP